MLLTYKDRQQGPGVPLAPTKACAPRLFLGRSGFG